MASFDYIIGPTFNVAESEHAIYSLLPTLAVNNEEIKFSVKFTLALTTMGTEQVQT
jgi:hypothetical protein